MSRIRTLARIALALIRLVNGVIGLAAPELIIRRFSEDGKDDPQVARYALRMFGVRTVLVAVDLLRPRGPERAHAVRVAPIIHASDTVAAVLAAKSGLVPEKTGRLIVAISATNTLLSLLMQGGQEDRAREEAEA